MKKTIRLTETDLRKIIREGVTKILSEAYRSGFEPHYGNGMVGGKWWASDTTGKTNFPVTEYSEKLVELRLIDEEGPEWVARENYFKQHEEEFILYAVLHEGEDESVGLPYDWEIEPDKNSLAKANNAIQNCPCLNVKAKAACIKWNEEFFEGDAQKDADIYDWDYPDDPDYEYEP